MLTLTVRAQAGGSRVYPAAACRPLKRHNV